MNNLVAIKEVINVFVQWGFYISLYAAALFMIVVVSILAYKIYRNVKRYNKRVERGYI